MFNQTLLRIGFETDLKNLQTRAKTLADNYPDDLNKKELVNKIECFKYHVLQMESKKYHTTVHTFKAIHEQHLDDLATHNSSTNILYCTSVCCFGREEL